MRDVTIVGDAGSTFLGRREFGFRLIDAGKEAGLDCVKFQLFEGEPYLSNGNIELPLDLFKEFYQYGKSIGMPVTASVFNHKAFEFVLSLDVHHIKFGYSMRNKQDFIRCAIAMGRKTVVTTNIHDGEDLSPRENLIKLVTQPRCKHADEYAIVTKMHFEGLFPDRFQGFSDHSLGFLQAQDAVNNGATWIEKHFRLADAECLDCPDGRFALTPKQLKEFVWKTKP